MMAAPAQKTEGKSLEGQVLEIVREMLLEQGKAAIAEKLNGHSSFQRDMGLASLDLVELVVRCETRLDMELPDEIAEQADTPAGWARAIQQGSQEARAKSVYRIVPPSGEALPVPSHAANLAEVLRWYAQLAPGRVHIHLFEEGSGQGITCARLLEEAETVARGLISKGLQRDETVAIMLPNSADFLYAFFGVMLAGGIPVPVYPPADVSRLAEYVENQCGILSSAGARWLISFQPARPLWGILSVRLPRLLGVTTVAALRALGRRAAGRLPEPSEMALIQYTSGSTGNSKGVLLRQEALLANIRAIGQVLEVKPNDAVVSWLPLASDMGLVGCWLFSLYHATPLTLLSPLEFERRPESWLWAIHDSRGTLSAAPNFAYEHCVRRIPMWTLEGIDLSCWRVAVNAGEPVLAGTVEGFTRRFRDSGFPPGSMLPCYGLAEASVALAMTPPGRPLLRDSEGHYSVGRPLPGHEVRIVEGRLHFRGPSRCAGYLGPPQPGEGEWIDTGDLARIEDGEIYITGRAKQNILKAGRNLAPQLLESAAEAVPGVRACSVAAIGVSDSSTGTERLVIVAESAASDDTDAVRVKTGVRAAVKDACGLEPDEVLLIPVGALPKTANGKLRRERTRNLYLSGGLRKTTGPVWMQLARLRCGNLTGLAWKASSTHLSAAGRAARNTFARLTALAGGCLARVAGPEVIPALARCVVAILGRGARHDGRRPRGPAVVMANRCSRLDPLTLIALCHGKTVFSGEEALLGLPPLARFLLRPAMVQGREQVEKELRGGAVVLLFPDCPVGVSAARSRYRLDALQAAIATGAAVVPLALRELKRQTHLQAGEALTPDGLLAAELRERARETLSGIYA